MDWIPGMKNMRLRDFPSFIRTRNPGDHLMVNFIMDVMENATRASGLILNTFDALEQDVLDPLLSMFPPICTIGPLSLLLNQIPDDNSIGSNLWREEPECLQWLDSQQPSSVVYVNFGSITVMTAEQLVEFAWGLANTGQPFLWIIRPDLVVGDSAILPPEFVAETKQRGLMASWCPQEKVLNHPSVGGFLTHCGWNSTIESICAGIPMVCWPFFAEQQTNCRYCTEWGIGMEIDNNVERGEVEKLVREMMEGEKGKNMKKAAMEWRTKAEEATDPCGTSYLNLDKLVDILLRKS